MLSATSQKQEGKARL